MSGTDHGGLELSAGMRGKGTYLLELECIRGLAILLVYLFHVWGITFGRHQGGVSFGLGYVLGGNTGVTLFCPERFSVKPSLVASCRRGRCGTQCAQLCIAATVTGKWEVAL